MNLRVTPREMVLEFGSIFPESPLPHPGPPGRGDFVPEVRVVMQISNLQLLADALAKAAAAQRTASQKGTPPNAQAQ
jgi:hypothetical protein